MFYTSQTTKVYNYLKKHKFITARMSYDILGITRLSARIKDLKNAGYEFDTNERDEHNYVKYKLIKNGQ